MDNRSELLSPSIAPNSGPAGSFPVVAIVGPTASGKSSLALFLAQRFRGEIVNYDSVQVYRGLDIGSAKLPPSERGGIPHHLLDIASHWEDFNAGDYTRLARQVMRDIQSRGNLPILVGGTGLYLKALLEGLSPAPTRDEGFRARLETASLRRPAILTRYLRRYDSAALIRIHSNDRQKLIRAVELTHLSRQPASQVQALPREEMADVVTLKIGLNPDREQVYQRINQRAVDMFSAGILTEAESAAAATPPGRSNRVLDSIGYRQARLVLSGQFTMAEAIEETQRKTRQYAKRQWTWFRKDPEVHWLPGFGDESAIQIAVKSLTADFLRKNGWLGISPAAEELFGTF